MAVAGSIRNQGAAFVTRIFAALTVLTALALGASFVLGMNIGDAASLDRAAVQRVTWHFLGAAAAVVLGLFVHALLLTYFMGTGRWLAETSDAYRLDPRYRNESQRLKLRVLPPLVLCALLLIVTAALGAAADPGSPVGFRGWGPLSAAALHRLVALFTVVVNLGVNVWQYQAVHRNGVLINEVVAEVRRIRRERGLDP